MTIVAQAVKKVIKPDASIESNIEDIFAVFVNRFLSTKTIRVTRASQVFCMTFYELQRLVDDRWLLEAVFPERAEAIEETRRRIAQARQMLALRVLKVEEQGNGFAEWLIYQQSTADLAEIAAARRRHRRIVRRLRVLPRSVIATARGLAEASTGRPPLWLVAGLVAASAALILFAQRPPQSRSEWVFDRPEAQMPHTVRNPLTGAVSH
jgi:hypothetical protein